MISNKPLVSVVIPTYKRPNMIARTIQSINHQTYDNIEIIIVDDNGLGTEMQLQTEKAVTQFMPDVTYLVHDINKGGSAARNTGWKAANGQYITFVDDDDELSKSKLEKQVECLENLDESWGCCYTAYELKKENGEYQRSSESRRGNCYVDALMRTMFMGSGSNLFLRKSVVDEIDGYDESFVRNQDIEFLARVCEKYKIAYIDEMLLTIHQDGARVSRTFEQIDGYSQYYLEKFKSRIEALPLEDRKRVISVISLERMRCAFYKKKYKKGICILIENKVNGKYLVRYMKYLIHRKISRKSYGFDGR